MKPLLSVICYNRKALTIQTLESLRETGALHQAEVVVFDNASIDGTWQALVAFNAGLGEESVYLHRSHVNIGCPKALNWVLAHKSRPGQHFIKVDNDVVLTTPDWVLHLSDFLEHEPSVAMVGPWYRELETDTQGRIINYHRGWWEIFPIIGHCVMHRGKLLNETGYFDVLADDHLYGFEDLLMAHRAGAAGYKCAVYRPTELVNIQRHNSLDPGAGSIHDGESREDHIARLRPEYERRRNQIHHRHGLYRVGPDGQEAL